MTSTTNKIITTLSLASSDKREEMIDSLVESALYEYNDPINFKELSELIETEFNITVHKTELETSIIRLCELSKCKNEKNIELTDEYKKRIYEKNIKLKDRENSRKRNFREFVDSLDHKRNINEHSFEILWKTFNSYIYQCFLLYGEAAIDFFYPTNTSNISETLDKAITNNALKEAFENLNHEQKPIFKKIVEEFSQKLNSDDIDYLKELALKTISFKSLGLSKELYDDALDKDIIDWTVFLDTNFLYSVLDLRTHPENYACVEMLKIINEHKLKIKFVYLTETFKELLRLKDELPKIPNTSYEPNQIRALLKSEKLDTYTQNYFKKLLDDPSATIKPIDQIENAQKILNGVNITPYRKKFDFSDEHINHEVGEYERYLTERNELRVQYKHRIIVRSEGQLYHDIYFRESISSLRYAIKKKQEPTTLNQVKYFGLTLDKSLVKYDKYKNYKEKTNHYPTFFIPSFLLAKLLRIIPIQTDNYNRAFLSAISSKVLSAGDNRDTSSLVMALSNKLRKMGVDDEQVFLNLVTEDLFLSEYKNKYQNDESLESIKTTEFIESALNKQLKSMTQQLEQREKDIIKINKELSEESTNKDSLEKQLSTSNNEVKLLRDNVKLFEKQIKKVQKEVEKNEDKVERDKKLKESQTRLNLENKIPDISSQSIINYEVLNNKLEKPIRALNIFNIILGFALIVIGLIDNKTVYLVFILNFGPRTAESVWNKSFNQLNSIQKGFIYIIILAISILVLIKHFKLL